MTELVNKTCKPCEGGIPPMKHSEALELLKSLKGWSIKEDSKLKKEYYFVSFQHTMDFVNKVAILSESEGHHPDLHISYGRLTIELWTHAINGLSENDFILAAKIDQL